MIIELLLTNANEDVIIKLQEEKSLYLLFFKEEQKMNADEIMNNETLSGLMEMEWFSELMDRLLQVFTKLMIKLGLKIIF